ncbi:MAG TPA: hypothetical protein VH186_35120 [Chloroflexia bacterium]|nr:hypothetical protein [Chloroflexia bacterium]
MNSEIRKRIEQNLGEGQHFSIERIASPGAKDSEHQTSRISAYVASELKLQLSEMFDHLDAAEAEAQPRNRTDANASLWTPRQLEKHLIEQISIGINNRVNSGITVSSGSRVFGPPYLSWHLGNALLYPDGYEAYTMTYDNIDPKATVLEGFSAAGYGFEVTTSSAVLTEITPQGNYDWYWAAARELPFVRNRGGMGIAVFNNSQQQPVILRQPILWSISGVKANTGDGGNGRIVDAATPAFGFGTIPLAPVLVNMIPDSKYTIWVWSWNISRMEQEDPFSSQIHFSMPLVTINANRPVVTH